VDCQAGGSAGGSAGSQEGQPVKTCAKCGQAKALEQFPPRAKARDGRHSYCRLCKKRDRQARNRVPNLISGAWA